MNSQSVSVVVPVRNRADLVWRCLDSISRQTVEPAQVIVIDACSDDGTTEEVQRFFAERCTHRDGWIHIVEPDSGQSDGINKGLSLAVCEYFAWLNADDYWEPEFLAEATSALEMHSESVMVSGAIIIEDGSRLCLRQIHPTRLTKALLLERQTMIIQPTTLFRTRAVIECGGLDTKLHYAMDYDLFIRLLGLGPMQVRDQVWGHFLLDPSTKSGSCRAAFVKEQWHIRRRYHARLFTRVNWNALVFWMKEPVRFVRAHIPPEPLGPAGD